MRGLDLGLTAFKFFPAETSGGIKALKALAAPFYQCRFCPTGGITEASAPDWLAFGPVECVGGSWVTGGTMAEVEARPAPPPRCAAERRPDHASAARPRTMRAAEVRTATSSAKPVGVCPCRWSAAMRRRQPG